MFWKDTFLVGVILNTKLTQTFKKHSMTLTALFCLFSLKLGMTLPTLQPKWQHDNPVRWGDLPSICFKAVQTACRLIFVCLSNMCSILWFMIYSTNCSKHSYLNTYHSNLLCLRKDVGTNIIVTLVFHLALAFVSVHQCTTTFVSKKSNIIANYYLCALKGHIIL